MTPNTPEEREAIRQAVEETGASSGQIEGVESDGSFIVGVFFDLECTEAEVS